MIALLIGIFLGHNLIETKHYQECRAIQFKSELCKYERKLCKLGKDKCE
jgi:hypothetical protein